MIDEKRIDMHTHTVYSDGSFKPHELVSHASSLGIAAVALTDHDTVGGIAEFMSACGAYGVEGIAGVELSSHNDTMVHILGYYIDPHNASLSAAFESAQEERARVHLAYMDRLNSMGFEMTEQEVRAVAPIGGIGRAHYARVMLNRGYVGSVKEAFDKYLAVGMPCYIERDVMSPQEAIALIHTAGGAAFLAHPHQTKYNDTRIFEFMKELKAAGLDGIEGYYTEYTPEMGKKYRSMACALGLLLSGGSDFHAEMKPHIELGYGTGGLYVPYSLLQPIRERAQSYR